MQILTHALDGLSFDSRFDQYVHHTAAITFVPLDGQIQMLLQGPFNYHSYIFPAQLLFGYYHLGSIHAFGCWLILSTLACLDPSSPLFAKIVISPEKRERNLRALN